MAQYDVYVGRAGGHFVDVQSDLIEGLPTRMLVPLYPVGQNLRPASRLHPTITIDGRDYFLATHLMAAFDKSQLGASKMNLLSRHDDISRAIYMLFQGF